MENKDTQNNAGHAKKKVAPASSKKAAANKDSAFSTTVKIFDLKGKEIEKIELDKKLFTGQINKGALYQAVVMYNATKRQGNASTKTRGDVSGGGKKPYRQKGTGRARAGSTRSPLWRHGGSVFGPHPRIYRYSLPKKIKRLAFVSSINSKLCSNSVIGISEIKLSEAKTRSFKAILNALKLNGKSLFVVDKFDDNAVRSSQNLQEVVVRNYRDFNTMDVLSCDNLVIARDALLKLSERVK